MKIYILETYEYSAYRGVRASNQYAFTCQVLAEGFAASKGLTVTYDAEHDHQCTITELEVNP